MPHDIVNIRADRRHQIDASEVRRSAGKANIQGIAVDHERSLAEPELTQLLPQFPRLAFLDVKVVKDDQIPVLGFRRQSHPQTEHPNLLVERRIEITDSRAVSLTAADEDRRTAIAVTSGTAALLLAEFLASPCDI